MISDIEAKRIERIAEEACIDAARDVNAMAALFGTDVIIEVDGKPIAVQPSDVDLKIA
tara:strand:+ start:3269 stop:3442 length:174 start_codon:yes stop_codon:yes gene_type:complete